jgi:ubiquinone/menaquinone biosynthesis C-methylase UbiE/DNA-binding MarR family transcriptional regulator
MAAPVARASNRASIFDRLTALADATRSRILLLLDRHELTVGELCAALQLPQSTVSRHLKILTDEGWLASRAQGTSRRYSMQTSKLDPSARRLWQVVRAQVAESAAASQDAHRLGGVLAQRRSAQIAFFDSAPGVWDRMRAELIGQRTDLLALLELLDDRWVVGDLGCGTGHVSEAIAPCVGRIVAVDESGPMLTAARRRLASFENVELRSGQLEEVPIDDESLDAAILFLVAHYVADPERVTGELARVLKPGGRLVIVDLMPHERDEYVLQMGHVWQGLAEQQMRDWFEDAAWIAFRYRPLPADPAAKGPGLFVASVRKVA